MTLTGIAFLLIFFTGCLLSLKRDPIWGLATYMIAFYLHPPGRWWGLGLPDLRWSLIASAIMLISYLFHSKKLESNGSFFSHGIIKVLFLFTFYLGIQLSWALDFDLQLELFVLYTKYMLLIFLIFRIIDTPEKLRFILWIHIAGCFTMGWDAYTVYGGGRFEGFVPPNVNEANAGALQLVTGVYTLAAVFLYEKAKKIKLALFGMMPFLINGIVTTISRSAFLELAIAALVFNVFTPKKYKHFVKLLSILAIAGFLALTSATYWDRINSIKTIGKTAEEFGEPEGAGGGRIAIMEAQMEMLKANYLGNGHRGTAVLSPYYLDERRLTSSSTGQRARSSHSTVMTMLVEHGIPGILIYLYLVWWTLKTGFKLRRTLVKTDNITPFALTVCITGLSAIFIGDIFVDYLKLESRLWFFAILIVLPPIYERMLNKNKSTTLE